MYSSLSSGTHHIFFPPRLQVVALEQDANCFPTDPWHQLPLDRLLRYQSNGPSGMPLRRLTANHRDNALLLEIVQHLPGTGALLLIESSVEALVFVTMAYLTNSLRRKLKQTRYLRRCHAFRKP
jgi:hypothetical protein